MASEAVSNTVESQAVVAVCQFNCGQCSKPMAARMPAMRVYNFPEVSGVTLAHERVAKCAECGATYIPLIKGVTKEGVIELAWKIVQTGESVIKAPTQKEMERLKTSKKM